MIPYPLKGLCKLRLSESIAFFPGCIFDERRRFQIPFNELIPVGIKRRSSAGSNGESVPRQIDRGLYHLPEREFSILFVDLKHPVNCPGHPGSEMRAGAHPLDHISHGIQEHVSHGH